MYVLSVSLEVLFADSLDDTPDEPEWHAPAPVYRVSPTDIQQTEVVRSPEMNRVVKPGRLALHL